MSLTLSRPKRGLPPSEALARWSDPAVYAELVKLARTTDLPTLSVCDNFIRDRQSRNEYQKKKAAAEAAFDALLRDGDVLSSTITEFGNAREVLHPSLWDILTVDHDFDEIVGEGRKYPKPEFFERTAIPLNIRSIPDWLDEELGRAGLNVLAA